MPVDPGAGQRVEHDEPVAFGDTESTAGRLVEHGERRPFDEAGQHRRLDVLAKSAGGDTVAHDLDEAVT